SACSSPGATWSPGSSSRPVPPPRSRSRPGCSRGRSAWPSAPSCRPSSPRPLPWGSRCGRSGPPGRRPSPSGAGSPTPSSRTRSRCARCTTASTSSSFPSSRAQHLREQLREEQVQPVEVEAEEDGGQDDDDGGRVDLLAARPGDLLELALDLHEEGLELPELSRSPAKWSRDPV